MTTHLEPAELLRFCNKVRKAGGAKRIRKLKPGIPEAPNACLIARNLNFDSEVQGIYVKGMTLATPKDRHSIWGMIAPREVLEPIAAALGLEIVDDESPVPNGYLATRRPGHWAAMVLPTEVAESARAFDRLDYPAELYESVKLHV